MLKMVNVSRCFTALAPAADFAVPVPETLSLLGIGALAFVTSRMIRKNKY